MSDAEVRRSFVVADREGLHARPCARVAKAARSFECTVTATWDGHTANARSVLELMQLMVPGGAAIEFHANGTDAAECLDAIGVALAASK